VGRTVNDHWTVSRRREVRPSFKLALELGLTPCPPDPMPPYPLLSEPLLEHAERDRRAGDPTDLLLVDEVGRLRMPGLEQLRATFDAGGMGLVLVGMPGLERRMARYDQLSSRIGFVHEFRPLGAMEVLSLLAGWRPAGVALPEDLLADGDGVATIRTPRRTGAGEMP
jgi:AAA domain